jgi:hypothetical protein
MGTFEDGQKEKSKLLFLNNVAKAASFNGYGACARRRTFPFRADPMFVLITSTLWRDPVARMAKCGKQFLTALVRDGMPTEALWANVVAFDQAAQSELLRLQAGELPMKRNLPRKLWPAGTFCNQHHSEAVGPNRPEGEGENHGCFWEKRWRSNRQDRRRTRATM